MRLEADHPLRTHDRIMDGPRGEVEAVAGVQGEVLSKFREAKGDRTAYHIDHLVVGMGVCGI
jgi:hypothetical protein